ncbi:hypothetical protein [Tritonibacter mobilis]|uniref:hypothetical protein n=1 Tax=Tritonibacter mobilis TaxID=379347 RepID=UPI000806B853|nr:hypothetical protein [Tritonibacter mobilis]MBU3036257.1 hypothetical protein [Tritonibacter mobilis]WHQ83011.1 hypothetical protein OMR53_02600 [Tritonibacter mobilis]
MIVAALILGVISGALSALSAGLFFDVSFWVCCAIYMSTGLFVTVLTLFVATVLRARREDTMERDDQSIAHA